MNRSILVVGYCCVGGIQTVNSISFFNRNSINLNINRSLEMPVCICGSLVSGALWPISLPAQVYLENKWNGDKTPIQYRFRSRP